MKTWMIFLTWLLVALSPLLQAGGTLSAGAPCFTRITGSVAVPAEVSGHVMFVNVMVNGRGPFCVLVDTGCSISVVSHDLATAVEAMIPDDGDEDQPIVATNGLGDTATMQRVLLSSVELGGVKFEGVQAVVSDDFGKLSTIEGRHVDGALGFPVFAELFLGLDFPNQRLLLSRQWPAGAPVVCASVPVIEHADVPFVEAEIQGRPLELMIDTGANHSLQLSKEQVPLFQWKVDPRVGAMVAVFGDVGRLAIGRLNGSMSLGGLEQTEPAAIVSTGPACLGLRFFERFCVIFHQGESRVWLCGTSSALTPPAAERSIGLSFYPDQGGLRIAGIIPGSPAEEAHLSVGSLVTQIENQPAASWSRDKLEQWINSHADVALVVANGTDERALKLRSWELVPE